MGLLDKLLGNDQPAMGPAWAQFLETQGLKPGQDVGPQRVTELLREYSQRQQASAQAPGVAKVLGASFGGVQADEYSPTASGDLVPSHYQTGDPAVASVVGLMANPSTRAEGVALGLQRLDPQTQAGLEVQAQQLSNAKQLYQFNEVANPLQLQGMRQAQDLANKKYNFDVTNANRGYELDAARTDAYLRAQAAEAQMNRAKGAQFSMTGGLEMKDWLAKGEETRSVGQAIGAGRSMVKILNEYGNLGKLASPQARAQLEVGIFSMIPALQRAINAGGQNALGTEEREYLLDFLGNPQSFLLRPEVTAAKLGAIVQKLEGDLGYRAETMPYLPRAAFDVPSYDLPKGLVLEQTAAPQGAQDWGAAAAGMAASGGGFGVPQ